MSKREDGKSGGDEYRESLVSFLRMLKARAKALEAGSTVKQESEESNDPEELIIFTEEDLREFFPEDDEEEPQIMKRNTFLDMLNGVDGAFDSSDEVMKPDEKDPGEMKEDKSDLMKLDPESKVREIMGRFEGLYLTEGNLHVIEEFFRFHINYAKKHVNKVRYNLLIERANTSGNLPLIEIIYQAFLDSGILSSPSRYKIIDEIELSSHYRNIDRYKRTRLLVITDCEGIERDSVAELSVNRRTELQEAYRGKNKYWDSLNLLPKDCIIIAVGTKGFTKYLRDRGGPFYRFFAHHLYLKHMTAEDVKTIVYKELEREKLKLTAEFREGLDQYIQVVYPKADLRDNEFADDLVNRILSSYFIKPEKKTLTSAHVPFYRKAKPYEEVMAQLDHLVGLNNVKKQFRTIYNLSSDKNALRKQRLHFAFTGNPGTGKTTVAKLTADMLYAMNLIRTNKLVTVKPTDVISVYVGESGHLMAEKIKEASGGVLFIDEAYFLISDPTDSRSHAKQCMEVLIEEMENQASDFTVILAGYKEEINTLMKSNLGLSSRISYVFEFEDYTNSELLEIFKQIAADDDMAVSEDAEDLLLKKFGEVRAEESFGNARTVEVTYQHIKSYWIEQNREERIIGGEDVLSVMPVVENKNLDDMIGLDAVKEMIKGFEREIKYIKRLRDEKMSVPVPNLHMLFTGNPGTGKTTVAKKIADILYHTGVLNTNKLITAERKDLVSDRLGGTASKTGDLIMRAVNGVLFIDEAYSLYMGPDDIYGLEAISTLLTAMEDYKDSMVVIFAGYKKEMQYFLRANSGIFSRIGYSFEFPDYTPEELVEMFVKKMNQYGFLVDTSAAEKVLKLMEFFSAMEDFGNGRFVERVVTITINNRARRSYARHYNDITDEDIPEIKDLTQITAGWQNYNPDNYDGKEEKMRTAVHEAGHALVSVIVMPGSIKRISLNQNARSLGRTEILRGGATTEKDLRGTLAVLFGGRNAERIFYQDHSTGCVHDILTAKKLATEMIDMYAMGEFGVTSSRDLLIEADRLSAKILQDHCEVLAAVAKALLESESGELSGEQLESCFGDLREE